MPKQIFNSDTVYFDFTIVCYKLGTGFHKSHRYIKPSKMDISYTKTSVYIFIIVPLQCCVHVFMFWYSINLNCFLIGL
jgi:hypothetical protein